MDTFTPNFFEFPNITFDQFVTSSPKDIFYNCIAFAAEDSQRWWWPAGGYWPEGVARETTVDAFIDAFATLGYESCDSATFEEGYKKIAIYTDAEGVPTHAARQLSADEWISKIGQNNDIHHANLQTIAGGLYGEPSAYMRKKV